MKRLLIMTFAFCMAASFTACGAFDTYKAKLQSIQDGEEGRLSEIVPVAKKGKVEIKRPGTYRVTGELNEIKIEAGDDDEVTLILDNVKLHNDSDYCINSKYCKLLTIVAVGDNTVTMEDEDTSAAIKAKTDLTVTGEGTITVNSAKKGVKCKKTFIQDGAVLDIQKSTEGIEAVKAIINDGTLNIMASDDGINATDSTGNDLRGDEAQEVYIEFNGGNIHINARGDGVDSNGGLFINGGNVFIEGPEAEMDGIIDYSTKAVITGGTFLGVGSSGMLESFDVNESTQGVIVNYLTETLNQGDELQIVDGSGNLFDTIMLNKKTQAYIYSSPEVAENETLNKKSGGFGGFGGPGGFGGFGGRGSSDDFGGFEIPGDGEDFGNFGDFDFSDMGIPDMPEGMEVPRGENGRLPERPEGAQRSESGKGKN